MARIAIVVATEVNAARNKTLSTARSRKSRITLEEGLEKSRVFLATVMLGLAIAISE
ncbi:hypothetical protein ACF3DV_21120 [Chlorogloeopsis fritschii PCC 9212]|uniref:hypothetical protein n=1 Tax=Chlorogloeopsis fritschii TaxID=1124 RepID=UPI0002FD12F7|nr:hypothetical protein [Chlorogloeopsis fritschii]